MAVAASVCGGRWSRAYETMARMDVGAEERGLVALGCHDRHAAAVASTGPNVGAADGCRRPVHPRRMDDDSE